MWALEVLAMQGGGGGGWGGWGMEERAREKVY